MKKLACFRHLNWNPDRAELRRFAIAMPVGFAVLGGMAALRHGGVGTTSMALWCAGVVLAAAAMSPLGRAAYLAVYVPASLMGWAVSHVLLAILFYGVFTPIAAVMRLTGADPLQSRLPNGASAWRTVEASQEAEPWRRQY